MTLHYELELTTKREKLVEQLLNLKGLMEKINVPDKPMGQLKPSSLAVAILTKELGFEPVLHLRSIDRNLLTLHSEIYGAYLFDIKEVLIVKGDVSSYEGFGKFDKHKLEDIVEKLKADPKLSNISLGLPLTNLNLDEKTKLRLSSKADFFVTLQIQHPKEIPDELLSFVKERNKRLQAYYILTSPSNKDILKNLGFELHQKSIKEHIECLEELEKILDAVVISCPRDLPFLLEFLRIYRKK